MKKRFFLFIVAFVLVLTLGACHLESKEVELGVSVSYNKEMVEQTAQQVTVEISADSNVDDAVISYTGLNPEVAEISSKGVIKALAPGEAEFKAEVVLGEYSKVIEFKVTVVALEYTISYELNGGENSELNPNGFASSDLPLELQPATKEGYKFLGWEYEGEIIEVIPADTTRNVELAAKWEVLEYAISYDLAGGAHKGEAAVEYTIEDEVVLGEAERKGYTFLGWYAGEEKVEKVEKGSTGDLALEAKWEVVEYAISYDLAGGAHVGEAAVKYTVEEEVVLGAAEKEGARFLGWYAGEEKVEKIAKGSTGEVTLVAKWQEGYEVEFDLAGGAWEGGYATFEEIGEAFLADFNKYGEASLTKESFFANSTPGIKKSFANAEMLAKWQWLFVYMLEDLTAINEGKLKDSYLADTLVALEKIIAGDKEVMSAVAAPGPNARTMIRSYMAGAMNKAKGSTNATFNAYVPDFSVEANQKALLAGHQELVRFVEKDYVLPTPVKEGYVFQGWYAGETKVEKVTADVKLVAKWAEPSVESKVTFDLAGGKFAEGVEVPATYVEGIGLATLPTPEKEGYLFQGWYLGETKVEAISAEQKGEVALKAEWKEKPAGNVVHVGAGLDYATLDEAVAAVEDGTTIMLATGEYTLGVEITKSVKIAGPNAGLKHSDARAAEALIKVAADVVKFNAAKVVFDGIELQGVGSNVAGVYFQDGANSKSLEFYSCVISTMNTFVKYNGAASEQELIIKDSKISKVGQFIVWTAKGVASVKVLSNYVEGSSCGTIANSAAALFRVRSGALEAYDNYFKGDSSNAPGYFEASNLESVVKCNTFDNVTRFVHSTAANKLIFDENLYLGADGKVLTSVPATLTNATADVTLATSEEDRAARYAIYAQGSEYKLQFELDGAETSVQLPSTFKYGDNIELPVLSKEGYIFLGWTLAKESTEYITKVPTTEYSQDLVIYAQFRLNAVSVGADKECKTIAEALAIVQPGGAILLDAATFDESIVIEVEGLRLVGTSTADAISTLKAIEIKAANVTVEGVKLTATESVKISGGSNITIKNCKLEGTPTADTQAMLKVTAEVKGLYILDSEFTATNTRTHYRAILSDSLVSEVVIKGNTFKQDCKDKSVLIDGVKLSKIAGNITVDENTFDWPGGNFTVYLGSGSVAPYTYVNMNNNVLNSAVEASGISVRNVNDTTVVNVIGNKFVNTYGNIIQVRGTGNADNTTKAVVNVLNNALLTTEYKLSLSVSSANLVVDNNYVAGDILWQGSYKGPQTNAAADENAALSATKAHKVSFNANGGTLASVPAVFYEGAEYPLSFIVPVYEGKRLLGWYDNAELAGEAVASLGDLTADATLYAKYEDIPVYNIEYVLNEGEAEGLVKSAYEGTVIELPTPVRFGATFLGWSLAEGSLDYITSFELTANTKVYANWTTAEVYEVELILNGGSIRYPSRDALLNDFFKDFNAAMGKSYAIGSVPTGSWDDIIFHTFFTKTLEDGTKVSDKWMWLAEYLYELSVRDLASNNCNVLGLKALINGSTYSGDAIYGISYAFRSFLAGAIVRPDTSYTSVDYRIYENANGYWEKLAATEPTKYQFYGEAKLPTPASGQYNFVGWYTNPEFTGEPVTTVSGATTLYAKYAEGNPVESISITNKVEEIMRYKTLQLVWALNPTNATIQTVKFESSNPDVATVSPDGLVTAVSTGTVTIKIISQAAGNKSDEFTMVVYAPGHFAFEYVGESYIAVGGTTQISAEYVDRQGAKQAVVFSSMTPELATVDAEGNVKGVAGGLATIRIALASDKDVYLDVYVTVLEGELSEGIQFVLDNHESNIFTRYELGIGAGTPAYYADIYGSVNKFLFNKQLEINEQFLAAGNASGDYYENANIASGDNIGLQFVTVHYTAGFDATADSDNHASYFTSGNADVSIHYVTGNAGNSAGNSEVYHTLDHKHGAWHAGDSGAYSRVGEFGWLPTGVSYDDCDLLEVKFTASDDFYYEINGKKTSIPLPATYNFSKNGVERNTDHIYNADGTISSQPDIQYISPFTGRTPESFFNDQGFPITVIDGEYYMGKTWWSYGQVIEGRICGSGGNRNSIGIESCVNKGSDLWYTWQITAKLVAKLLYENNLGIERVKGHHFFDGKDCPQPLLENNLEIWWEFIGNVQAELEVLKEFEGYEFEFKSNNPEIINDHGRVINVPDQATAVSYTVTVTKGEVKETITLVSMVPGIYEK